MRKLETVLTEEEKQEVLFELERQRRIKLISELYIAGMRDKSTLGI